MKRILLLTVLIASVITEGKSQDTTVATNNNYRVEIEESQDKFKVETNHFFDNCFVTIGIGGQIFFSDHNKQMKSKDRFTPAINAGVGKWFTPGLGVRLMYNGYKAKGLTKILDHSTGKTYDWSHSKDYSLSGGPLYEQEVKFYHLHGDVLFNLNNLFCGYKEARFWSIIPYAGLGYAVTNDSYKAKEVTANIGLINQIRLGKSVDLNVDVMGMLVNDCFDGENGRRMNDGILSATIGLVYKFNERKWNKRQDRTVYDMTEANSLRNSLEKANAENERLQKEMANKKPEVIVEKEVIASPNYVTFKINSTELSKEARVSLGLFAETIKKGASSSVYVISGYADASTGSKKINERLSVGRAEAVYNCLIKEFGISPKQLEVNHKGGVDNMFYNEPYLSRAVITRIK